METVADIFELVEAVDAANNVKSISYDRDLKQWTVSYKSDLENDKIDTESLVDFLYNG